MTKKPDVLIKPFGLTDVLAAATRSTVGAIPVIGPALTEIIVNFIPNQRADRISAYLQLIDLRLQTIEQSDLLKSVGTSTGIGLIEDGGYQAARASSSERIAKIAEVVAAGLKGDELKRIEASRILKLLDQVDESQIALLASHTMKYRSDPDFEQRHPEAYESDWVVMAATKNEKNKAALRRFSRDQLSVLGLLTPVFRRGEHGLPKYDNSGAQEVSYYDVSYLGYLLLREVGLLSDDEH